MKEFDLESMMVRPNDVIIKGKAVRREKYDEALQQGKCPECGAELIFEGGCMHCPECGWEACGA